MHLGIARNNSVLIINILLMDKTYIVFLLFNKNNKLKPKQHGQENNPKKQTTTEY